MVEARTGTWNGLGAFQQEWEWEQECMMMPTRRNSSAGTECDGTQRIR